MTVNFDGNFECNISHISQINSKSIISWSFKKTLRAVQKISFNFICNQNFSTEW